MRRLGSRNNCELCLIDNIEDYEKQYFEGTKQRQEIIKELQTSSYKWTNHVREHVQLPVTAKVTDLAPQLVQEYVDLVHESAGIIDRIREKVEEFSPKIHPDADPHLIKSYIQMESELGRMLERIGRISGDIKGMTKIQNQNVTIEYNNVIEHVLQNTCPKCKINLSKSIPDVIKVADDNKA